MQKPIRPSIGNKEAFLVYPLQFATIRVYALSSLYF
jgi:hypothetical protein